MDQLSHLPQESLVNTSYKSPTLAFVAAGTAAAAMYTKILTSCQQKIWD